MNLHDGLDAMLEHFEELQAPSDATVTHICQWRGNLFPCVITTERRGEQVELGGDVMEVAITVFIRVSVLQPFLDSSNSQITADQDVSINTITTDNDTIEPAPNHAVEISDRSRTYRIAAVRLDGPESHYALDLVDPYRP